MWTQNTVSSLKLDNSFSRRFFGLCLQCLSSTSCPCTWIEEPCSLLRIAHSLRVRRSHTIGCRNTKNYKMPVSEGIRLMAADSGLIKTGLSVVLNHELTDVHLRWLVLSLKVLWTFSHVHQLFLLSKYHAGSSFQCRSRDKDVSTRARSEN